MLHPVPKQFYEWDIFFKMSEAPLRRTITGGSFGEIFNRIFDADSGIMANSGILHIKKITVRTVSGSMLCYE
jgi:hypothetical protein